MTLSVKGLLLRHNELSLNPQHPLKKLYILICACNLSMARTHQKILRFCRPTSPDNLKAPGLLIVIVSKVMCKAVEKDIEKSNVVS